MKCMKLKPKVLPQSLTVHMEVLSQLRHRHLVSIVGHCIVAGQDHPSTAGTVYIVHEHVSNGSLRDYLNGKANTSLSFLLVISFLNELELKAFQLILADWRKKEMLKWPQRMAITIGVARGVQFLHTGIAPGIFGNKLKIENVLLDNSLSAKISGYNIPLPSKVNSHYICCICWENMFLL